MTGATLRAELLKNVETTATLITDELPSYNRPSKLFAAHERINHSVRQYARVRHDGLIVHTNTAESFFALMKRGHYGTYHKTSKRHLHRYCDEFGFRWDRRKICDEDRTVDAMRAIEGKRLMYQQPVADE